MPAVSFSTIAQRDREAAKARAAFDALSFTRRKEHVESVTTAKRPQTRAARIARVVASLRSE